MSALVLGLLPVAVALGGSSACMFGVSYDGLFTDAVNPDGSSPDGAIPDGGPPPVQATAVASGNGFSCALRADGTVTCWGYNNGRLGAGTDISSSTPVLVKDVGDAIAIAAGGSTACALRKSGAVACWGANGYGQLGDGTTNDSRFPVKVLNLEDATQLALGNLHACALKKDATVVCWGINGSGQLGDGTTDSHSSPKPVTGLTDVSQIAAFEGGTCAVAKGEVFCWGDNDNGTLGTGDNVNSSSPKKVSNLTGVASVASGPRGYHVCAILTTGESRCWGAGWSGSLGNGDGNSHDTPVTVSNLPDAAQITNGYMVSCARKKDGTVACWGLNDWHQLGVGDKVTPQRASTPLAVPALATVKDIAFGNDHVCAVWGAGRVSCWGSDIDGRLGRGRRLMTTTPIPAVSLAGVSALGLGTYHGCAVSAGAVSCWGDNANHQLTDDNAVPASATPLALPSLSKVKSVKGGDDHACALMLDGKVSCWGWGYYGQLGQGANSNSGIPVAFGSDTATAIDLGSGFTCALLTTGEVACSGVNDNERLGRPGADAKSPVRVQLDSTPTYLSGATALAVGEGHACAIVGAGDVICWGTSWDGRAGTTQNVSPPTKITLPSNAKAIAAGGTHSCAILDDGSVRCWGGNDDGQIGGSGGGPAPHTPLVGKPAKLIATGRMHSCAALDDGTVWCWGTGRLGQLGSGDGLSSPTPVQVKGITNAALLSAHDDTTCAGLQDGKVVCWGENPIGELADGSELLSGVPQPVVGY